jgi:hypothetical protein
MGAYGNHRDEVGPIATNGFEIFEESGLSGRADLELCRNDHLGPSWVEIIQV